MQLISNEPQRDKAGLWGFRLGSKNNQPVQSKKKAESLKFWINVEEKLYYMCSENKGAYQPAVIAHLFLHRQKSGFLMTWLK